MEKEIRKILSKNLGYGDANKAVNELLALFGVSGLFRYSERDVDFTYWCGVFNVSGIDGLHKEIQRLKEIGKDPHDIIDVCRIMVTKP